MSTTESLRAAPVAAGEKPSICFVSLDNYAALVDDPRYGRIGGAERQQAIIGRNLAALGYRVTFVTLDHGQNDRVLADNVRVIKAYKPHAGIRVLRFVHPRLTSLWNAMLEADADIYYQRTRDSVTGIVAAFCRRHHRKFVFAVAHDYDCMTDRRYLPQWHARTLYRHGLRSADLVIAQTATQKRLLADNFAVESTVIPNCAPPCGSHRDETDGVQIDHQKRLLWVGAFTPAKRLEVLLDIAEQLPDIHFDVVGDSTSRSGYVRGLRSRSTALANVSLHGMLSHAAVHDFYRQAAALICTSRAEGYPNIFLEAWSHGVPVVTTFDPDGQIAEHGLGVVAKGVSELAGGIRTLLDSQKYWQEVSQAALQHYRTYHSVEAVIPRLEETFRGLVGGTKP